MLPLRISASSGVPVYLQLEQQIKQAIASGLLHSGDALPSTRRTAAELRINPNTVARAFQNLEREGVIRTVPGKAGTFVASEAALSSGLLESEKTSPSPPARTTARLSRPQYRLRLSAGRHLAQTAGRGAQRPHPKIPCQQNVPLEESQ